MVKSRTLGKALAWTAVVLATAICSRGQDAASFLSFNTPAGKLKSDAGRTLELEIDSLIGILWDRPGLLTALSKIPGPTGDDAFSDRLTALEGAVGQILTAQEQQLAVAGAMVARSVAIRSQDTKTLSLLESKLGESRARLSSIGIKAVTTLKSLEHRDPVFFKELKPALDLAISEGDYAPLAEAVNTGLRHTGEELSKRARLGSNVEVYMEAKIVDRAGHATRVHVDGYDSMAQGTPTPFARYQTVVDERARRDLMAAQSMANFANQFVGGTFQAQVRDTLRDLRSGLDDLHQSLSLTSLKENLTDILNRLAGTQGLELTLVRDDVRSLLGFVDNLSQAPTLAAGSDMDKLIEFSSILNVKVRRLITDIREAPTKLRNLSDNLKALVLEKPTLLQPDSIAKLDVSTNVFMKHLVYFNQLIAQYQLVTKSLDVGIGVAQNATDLLPKTLLRDEDLDTKIDLRSSGVARHPGDMLVVDVSVMETDPSSGEKKTVSKGRQVFRLETYGFYLETRGALLLVDPRSPIQRKVSYQPTIGLAYHWKYGMRNNPFWNHDMSFGLGFSLAMLDFSDSQPIEIGLAVSATFFRDILWIGYGRNLQAKANYFYIGLNLTEFFSLLRR